MIEVLVAIMILSVGLLGLAGLQSAGLTHNQSANSRSSASMLAYGLLDSMRANKVVAEGVPTILGWASRRLEEAP